MIRPLLKGVQKCFFLKLFYIDILKVQGNYENLSWSVALFSAPGLLYKCVCRREIYTCPAFEKALGGKQKVKRSRSSVQSFMFKVF